MMPNTSLNIHAHICAETTVGIAQGIRTAARSRPRPRNWALSASAMPRPEHGLDRHRDDGEHQRVPDRAPPVRIGQQVDEVGEADELRGAEVGEVGVGEARTRSCAAAASPRPRQHQQHRRQEQPGGPGPLRGSAAMRARPPSAAPAGAAMLVAAMAAVPPARPIGGPPTSARRATAGRASSPAPRGWSAPPTCSLSTSCTALKNSELTWLYLMPVTRDGRATALTNTS